MKKEKIFLDRKMTDLFGLVFDRPKVILAVMTSCLSASAVAYGKIFFFNILTVTFFKKTKNIKLNSSTAPPL